MKNTLGKNTRILLLSYIGLLCLAAFFYPGGNYIEKKELDYLKKELDEGQISRNEFDIKKEIIVTPYYKFKTNFISDLGRTTSHSGDDNTISIVLFSIGMLTQIFASFYYLYNAAEFFSKDKPRISIIAKISAAFGSISLLGVVFTPADVPSLYGLHIFFANSVFNCALLTLGIYAYLFYSKGLKNVTYALFICSFIVFGYIVFLEVGPAPWKSIDALTMHATYQKVAVLSLIGTIWIMSKGTDLLDYKI
tara:strand:+ start:33 stop:782 length:750 start_codon:yes stop_codon:yes gene_type:complete